MIFQCKPGKNLKPGVVLLKVTIIEESPGNSQFFVLYYCYLLLGGSKKHIHKGFFFRPRHVRNILGLLGLLAKIGARPTGEGRFDA